MYACKEKELLTFPIFLNEIKNKWQLAEFKINQFILHLKKKYKRKQ